MENKKRPAAMAVLYYKDARYTGGRKHKEGPPLLGQPFFCYSLFIVLTYRLRMERVS